MFTATLIFQLIDERKLSLSTTLDKFFPQIANSQKITIEQLLAHRSGIHDVSEDSAFRITRFNTISKDEVLRLIANAKPDFEPGTRYAYCNCGFFILGMIIEKISGQPYELLLNQKITSKIGLRDTYPGTGNIDSAKGESFSYKFLLEWQQDPPTHISHLFGSGALISTASDLSIFIQALFEQKLFSKESLSQMMQKNLGIDTFNYDNKVFYGHTGGIDGFGAWVMYLPSERLALAYTTNGKVYPVSKIIDGVMAIYRNEPFTIPSFESISVSPEILEKYVGIYSSPGAQVKFTITHDNSRLFVQMTGKQAIPLEPMSEDKFTIESAGLVLKFDPTKNQMTLMRSGGEKIFTREK